MKSLFCVPSNFFILTFVCIIRTVLSRDAPIVSIPGQGQISGFFIKMFRTQTIVGYLGIPYAEPPVEERRFMPPSGPFPSWQGVRDGSIQPAQCWSDFRKPNKVHDELFYKLLGIDPKVPDETQYSEDCLYLNIYIPDGEPNEMQMHSLFRLLYASLGCYHVSNVARRQIEIYVVFSGIGFDLRQ